MRGQVGKQVGFVIKLVGQTPTFGRARKRPDHWQPGDSRVLNRLPAFRQGDRH